MYLRRSIATLAITLLAVSCADQTPVEPDSLNSTSAALQKGASAEARASLLTDIPVTQALPGGGTLEGLLSITELGIVDGELVGTGTLTGTVTDALGSVTEFTQSFTDLPLDLLGSGPGGSCQILNLDLGPLDLDLLGLTVDLSALSLDVAAQRGPGKLLGNLLCSLTGLLDQGGPLSALDTLLGRINGLLGGLLG